MKYSRLLNMYKYYYLRWRSKGITDDLNPQLDNDKLYETYDKLISNDYVLKIYHVTGYPRQLPQSLHTLLRASAPKGCYVDIYSIVDRHVIDWSSKHMQKVKQTWEKSIKDKPSHVDKKALNTSEDYKASAKTNDAIDSWNLVASKTAEGHATVDTEVVVLCYYRRPIDIKTLTTKEKNFLTNCSECGLALTVIQEDMYDILSTISPTAIPQKQPVKILSTMLDENVSLFEPYTPGKIGGKKIYLGREVDYGMFVFEDLLNTKGGALNMLIVARTGAGKTFYIKFLANVLLNSGINVVIWDKDGEYELLCAAEGMHTISLGSEGGKYYNTVPIPTLIPNGLSLSTNDTLTVFEMLADANNGMNPVERYLFNLAYNYMLEKTGIDKEDRSTWSKSNDLDYSDVYNSLLEIEDLVAEEDKEIYSTLKKKLFVFFDPVGTQRQMFSEPLNIEEILHKKEPTQPLMICINMQSGNNPNKGYYDKLLDKIKSNTMYCVSTRIIDHNKSIGEFTALIVEEINRHLENNSFITMVNDEVTGGRKKNLVPILVTNSISGMLNSDNRLLQDIVDNMDTIIAGSMNSSASKLLQERYSLQSCATILNNIAAASKSKTDSKYTNAFLVRTKSELAVVKATVPEHLATSKLFATRTLEHKGVQE